jgi:hypothetical protein
MALEILLYSSLALLIWIIVGCAVMAALDDESLSLLEWVKSSPFGFTRTVIAWPALAAFVLRHRKPRRPVGRRRK